MRNLSLTDAHHRASALIKFDKRGEIISDTILNTILLLVGGAIGYFADRWIRRSKHIEDTESLRQIVELKRLLEAEGMSFEEARALRDSLSTGKQAITPAMAKAIAQHPEDAVPDDTRDFGTTTVELVSGMQARRDSLDEEIETIILQLMRTATDNQQRALRESHSAWLEFRSREGEAAGLEMEGGSGQALLNLAAQVELSERRLNELRSIATKQDNRY